MLAIRHGEPSIVLAPMEGITDFCMRSLFSELGGFDFCVSEFLRVNDLVPPTKVFHRHVPELLTGGKTRSGVAVQVQLLGGNAERLAETAVALVQHGALGIDLNFGCPAPTVNRHDGGAALLRFPFRIRQIVEAVRKAVPVSIPVSAKLRLGWDGVEAIDENAERAAEGGANWLTIHARTRMQGYALPVYWKSIGPVRKRLGIPIVANGEIDSLADLVSCQELTGCEHFMLGRGAFADPLLAQKARSFLRTGRVATDASSHYPPTQWNTWLNRFEELAASHSREPQFRTRRMKQWVHLAQKKGRLQWFDQIKCLQSSMEILNTVGAIETHS